MERYRSLRVLHIMSGFGGGISSFIFHKAQEMPAYQVQMDVVTYDECSQKFIDAIRQTGGDVYQLQNPKRAGWRAFKRSFTRVLELYQYDAIHCHVNGYRTLPYKYYCHKYGQAKFYVHAHQTYGVGDLAWQDRFRILFDQWVNRQVSDSYLGCGEAAIRGVYGDRVPRSEMMMIPNSIELSHFDYESGQRAQLRQEVRETYQLATSDRVIGQIARLRPVKNHVFTLELMTALKALGRSEICLCAGEGELKANLTEEIERRDLSGTCRLIGRVSPIAAFYPGLDVLLLPSLFEGLPTVVVEAQAAGVPVVMADTITAEVDFGLNMVQRLSLEAPLEEWIAAIDRALRQELPVQSQRLQVLKDHYFDNQSSAKLYVDFLHGYVQHYRI